MNNLAIHSPHRLRVTALFGDHHQCFDLATGTTFGQVAERLAEVSQVNHDWPLGISIVFDAELETTSKAGATARQSQEPNGGPC